MGLNFSAFVDGFVEVVHLKQQGKGIGLIGDDARNFLFYFAISLTAISIVIVGLGALVWGLLA